MDELYFSVLIKNTGKEDEHKVGIAIQNTFDAEGNNWFRGYWLPLFVGEDFSGGWEARIKLRIATFEEPCECNFVTQDLETRNKLENPCEYHKNLLDKNWTEEDADAVDSWMESRGDLNAMMRRVERTILKRHAKEESKEQ